ncbi:hypothetical protein [Nocardiopsis oceani]
MSNLQKFQATLFSFLLPRSKNDKGAGIVEYAAILILVAAIAVAVFNLGLVERISQSIGNAVSEVTDGP